MKIESNLLNQLSPELRRLELEQRFELRQRAEALGQAENTDRLELGGNGSIDSMKAMLLENLSQADDLRGDKIALAKERIASGFYSEGSVVNEMADKMMEQSAILDQKQAQEVAQSEPAYRQALMSDVQEKIESGFYTDHDVMGFVADRLLQIHDVPDSF